MSEIYQNHSFHINEVSLKNYIKITSQMKNHKKTTKKFTHLASAAKTSFKYTGHI